jgi:CspA family cold shock protein
MDGGAGWRRHGFVGWWRLVVAEGKVVRFDRTRGYGFIAPESGGEDVFVHANELDALESAIGPGTKVSFQTIDGERGLKAYDVRLVDPIARPEHNKAPTVAAVADDECEVLAEHEFLAEVTEQLIAAVPTLTGAQIATVRTNVAGIARSHGWLE